MGTRRAIPGAFAENPAAHFRGEQKGAGPSRRTHGPAKLLNAHQTITCWPTQKSRTQMINATSGHYPEAAEKWSEW